jgi:hypothetical protein
MQIQNKPFFQHTLFHRPFVHQTWLGDEGQYLLNFPYIQLKLAKAKGAKS